MLLYLSYFFSLSALIKDFHFLRGGNTIDVQQLKVYCLPAPQTNSNYHAHSHFLL